MKTDNTNELAEVMFTTFRLMKTKMSFTNNFIHLSILQIHALMFLCHNKSVDMSDIAEYFHIEMPSATSLINKLCDHKLVTRYEDPKDRRLVKITLTSGGKKLVEQAMCERRKKLEKMLSYLSDKEKSDLSIILTTLNTRLQKIS
jgi:MarR family transcriptional regulator, organic hydroperoxide resistance regulator